MSLPIFQEPRESQLKKDIFFFITRRFRGGCQKNKKQANENGNGNGGQDPVKVNNSP